MKRLLITLILVSPFSFAEWGDVYYCQMTSSTQITPLGKRSSFTLERLQFKLDKTKRAMVFGSGGSQEGVVAKLTPDKYWPSQDTWYAEDKYTQYYFQYGKLIKARVSPFGIVSFTADCDKF
jgi:alpha-tubulin suppressor-like RCC1 family protein